ncbi:hypothetical protein PGTUg99_030839 [Puccinia graminis f. sp. tritici]|uniref:Uncharacterized protein n=1 Tax=Puccinia graminis f. sp. tritici TaxID=56615 RepID=A0A5B0RP68_PUCGR|nr:hypothetical protein PGTUg99_030839 [Puccinia graminis f. sp. tritici]
MPQQLTTLNSDSIGHLELPSYRISYSHRQHSKRNRIWHRSRMSHPLVGDPEWDQLQCNYDPLGEHTPLTGRFSNTTVSDLQPFSLATPSTTSAHHDTNPHRGLPQTTTAGNPPAIPPRPQSHTGPVRNVGVRRMVPSTSPYGSPYTQSDVRDLPQDDNLLASAMQHSNTSLRCPSRSSTSTSTGRSSSSRPESLDTIQSSLQAIQSTFHITDELLQRAQPLLQMSQEARTTAILLLALQNNISPQPTATSNAGLNQDDHQDEVEASHKGYKSNKGFRAYLRQTIRVVLLEEDIDCYGYRSSQRLKPTKTPVGRLMEMINSETPQFRKINQLPPDLTGPNDELEKFIADQVKTERSYYARLLKVGVGSDTQRTAVPSLYTLIADVYSAMHPSYKRATSAKIHADTRITKAAKIRISYLRFMVNLHQLNLPNKPIGKTVSFWDDIDEDLKRLRQKSPAYGIAYNQLIFDIDQRLWNDSKTIDDVPEADQQPPSEQQVVAKINLVTANPATPQSVGITPKPPFGDGFETTGLSESFRSSPSESISKPRDFRKYLAKISKSYRKVFGGPSESISHRIAKCTWTKVQDVRPCGRIFRNISERTSEMF